MPKPKNLGEQSLAHIRWLVRMVDSAREIIADSVDFDEDDDEEVRDRLVEIRRFFGITDEEEK